MLMFGEYSIAYTMLLHIRSSSIIFCDVKKIANISFNFRLYHRFILEGYAIINKNCFQIVFPATKIGKCFEDIIKYICETVNEIAYTLR